MSADPEGTYYTEVKGCARCQGDHTLRRFIPFLSAPPGPDGHVYTHRGWCPLTQEPILMVKE